MKTNLMKKLSDIKGMGTLGIILVIGLLIAMFSSYPGWQHAHNWGYVPFGGFGIVFIILIVLLLTGKL